MPDTRIMSDNARDLLDQTCAAVEACLERGRIKEAAAALSSLPPDLLLHQDVVTLRIIIHLRSEEYGEAYELAKMLHLREPEKVDLIPLVTRYRIFASMMAQSAAWLRNAAQEGTGTTMHHHLVERYRTAQKNFDDARLALSQGLDTYHQFVTPRHQGPAGDPR